MPRNILEVIYQPKKSWYPGSSKTHLQAKVVWNMFPIYFEYFSSWAELWFVFVFIFIFVSIFVFELYLYGSPWYVWVLKLPTSLKKLFLFWPHWFQPKYCENLICTFIFKDGLNILVWIPTNVFENTWWFWFSQMSQGIWKPKFAFDVNLRTAC